MKSLSSKSVAPSFLRAPWLERISVKRNSLRHRIFEVAFNYNVEGSRQKTCFENCQSTFKTTSVMSFKVNSREASCGHGVSEYHLGRYS